MLVGDSAHDVIKWRRLGIDQLHRIRDNRACQGFALFAGGLISLVEDAQQLRMGGEHAGIEVCGDRVGVRGDDGRGCLDHAQRLVRQEGPFRRFGEVWHGYSLR